MDRKSTYKDIVDRLTQTDPGSTHNATALRRYLHRWFRRLDPPTERKLLRHYDADTLDRRAFIQLLALGSSTALAASVGLHRFFSIEDTPTGYATADPTTVTLDPGETRTYQIGDGETWGNRLIDVTASNTKLRIVANGSDWTIRNVGIRGTMDREGGYATFGFVANGNCTVENVYIGDGSVLQGGAGHAPTGMWLSPDSSGSLTARGINVQGWKDNGLYFKGPRTGCPVTIDRCYAGNNDNSDYRIGSAQSKVINSVVHHTGDVGDSRGVWCWYDSPGKEIRNCHINMNGYGSPIWTKNPNPDGRVDVYDSQVAGGKNIEGNGSIVYHNVGNNPEDFLPEGCPASPEDAACLE